MHSNVVTSPLSSEPRLPKPDDLRSIALLLDVDGTMIDFGPSPLEVHVSGGLKDSLSRLKKGQTVSVKGTCQRRMGPVVLEECIIQ